MTGLGPLHLNRPKAEGGGGVEGVGRGEEDWDGAQGRNSLECLTQLVYHTIDIYKQEKVCQTNKQVHKQTNNYKPLGTPHTPHSS